MVLIRSILVGSAFNTILRPTFKEQGLGSFCLTGLSIPSSMDGMNATIQVVTNGDPFGGLYNCADVTLSATASGPGNGVCKNGTGVSVTKEGVSGNPNTTSGNSTSKTSGGAEGAMAKLRAWMAVAGLAAIAFML